jgi:hypothetical protein
MPKGSHQGGNHGGHHTPADRPWYQARPWLATTRAGFAGAVDKLKRRDKHALFIVLTKAAASGDWASFNAAMAQATRVQDVGGQLAAGSTFALSLLYGSTGLPAALYPLFEAVVMTAWSACREVEGLRPGRPLRILILNKVFARPEIKALEVPQVIHAMLYA